MERYIVADNACGWPKLTMLKDGRINMDIHNKPSHGSPDGSAVCYQSTDDGRSFKMLGTSGEGSMENGAFVDKACGEAHNGDYIVIVQNCKLAQTHVYRSKDGGVSFEQTGTIESGRKQTENHGSMPFPYGTISKIGKNKLAFHYFMNTIEDWEKGYADAVHESHICISNDDGLTWTEDYVIDTGINETALLFYDEMNGIAVGRIDAAATSNKGKQRTSGGGNKLYRTKDGGKTWAFEMPVLGQGMLPTHLLLLKDGRTLMTFGLRFANVRGVMVTISEDNGQTWNEPNMLVRYEGFDGGYPSSIQTEDGTIVTAYYSSGNFYHTRYHVGVIRWNINELIEGRWMGRPATFFMDTDEEYVHNYRIL